MQRCGGSRGTTTGKIFVAFSLLLVVLPAAPSSAGPLDPAPTCLRATTFVGLTDCLSDRVLGRGTGYTPPSDLVLEEWRLVVRTMLAGGCADATLGPSLRDVYRVLPYADEGGEIHCVALETDESRTGWGTFIVRRSPTRMLSIQITHPVADVTTEHQGAAVYHGTGAATFYMAGAHRAASDTECDCQGKEPSDAAHVTRSLFHVAVEETDRVDRATGGDLLAIQFHGMADDSCPEVDVHLTDGTRIRPRNDSLAIRLRDLLNETAGWHATVPGDPPGCHLNGTTNVQGRLLNGVPATKVCSTPAKAATGRFLHAEQVRSVRDATVWVDALQQVL